MYEFIEHTKFGDIRYACADMGKKILICNGILTDRVAMGNYSKLEDFVEVVDGEYIPPTPEPENPQEQLTQLQENQIRLSKGNLAKYLEENPLFSTVHKKEGEYYRVTQDKQQELVAQLTLYTVAVQNGLPYTLTWNATNKPCEVWTQEELMTLSLEIGAYVKPLVSMQQHMEADIRSKETQEEVLSINVEFTKENTEAYRNQFLNSELAITQE